MTLHRRLTSDAEQIAAVRKAAEAFAVESGCAEDTAAGIGLCLNEAIANVIRHAYDGERGRPIELDVTDGDDRLCIVLRDWGNGRVPDLSKPRDLSDIRPGGLGLPCMQRLLDDLQFEPQPDGMVLRMTKMKRKS